MYIRNPVNIVYIPAKTCYEPFMFTMGHVHLNALFSLCSDEEPEQLPGLLADGQGQYGA